MAPAAPIRRSELPATCWLIAAVAMASFACMRAEAAPKNDPALPQIGPAPQFALTDQDGRRFALAHQRGKVAVVTFIFTGCADSCPILTAKLVGVQRTLAQKKQEVFFIAITVDPLNDTPAQLRKYAMAQSANLDNFAFLTGSFEQVEDVARRYGVFRKTQKTGNIDHTFLTSLVDRHGIVRVQYIGSRFDPVEFETDLRSLLAEKAK